MIRLARNTATTAVIVVCLLFLIWAVCSTGPLVVGADNDRLIDRSTADTIGLIAGIIACISGLLSNFQNRMMIQQAKARIEEDSNRIAFLEAMQTRHPCTGHHTSIAGQKPGIPTCA